jgi:hypothetical protein
MDRSATRLARASAVRNPVQAGDCFRSWPSEKTEVASEARVRLTNSGKPAKFQSRLVIIPVHNAAEHIRQNAELCPCGRPLDDEKRARRSGKPNRSG